ncbi:MAG TPA: hypothetical protein VIS71_09745 [Terrimicrobium sp.]
MKNQFTHKEEPQYWTRRYEELREGAAGGLIGSDCPGMSVLIRRGLVAWMRAWRDPLSSATGVPACAAESHPIPAGRSWQREATLLLANMALSHLRRTP